MDAFALGDRQHMMRLGRVPRWMPLLSGTASGYDETGTGASVDAFALGDRQHIMRLGWVPWWMPLLSGPWWMPLLSGTASNILD